MLIEQTSGNEEVPTMDYFKNLACDNPNGRDSIERLFRSYSLDGHHLLSTVTSQRTSNGYAEYLFRYLAMKLFSIDLSNQEIQYVVGRNQDIAEAILYSDGTTQGSESATPLLKFARIYGFRNIQGVILKMKRSKCDYDYVEIMACPSGCVNGGGQIKLTTNETPNEIQSRVSITSVALHSNLMLKSLEDSPLVQCLYESHPGDEDLTSSFSHYFQTQYHAIPKLELLAPMASKW